MPLYCNVEVISGEARIACHSGGNAEINLLFNQSFTNELLKPATLSGVVLKNGTFAHVVFAAMKSKFVQFSFPKDFSPRLTTVHWNSSLGHITSFLQSLSLSA